ncbi:AraC family transcriptional regulator [Dasania sp. GY-MA-18]|uniref:AraC family transcriptional regulator n=1 Tax=Dasania phycosphaerae TaxID=2950436 RepID=A0A9J6RN45_9GAMM|nr:MULTISPECIES: AraC family transcriptional regulator [Dasania]MCR8923176.1 AraC family transcriptional regulator [Dasania sp. GY-MA-18]MCZ0865608.1 AraC family transcriptional regulator [Dasania phycosphaerae]MCZ0869333.1 AraC family transcriptional regulator [Dasania phycosphaerae]
MTRSKPQPAVTEQKQLLHSHEIQLLIAELVQQQAVPLELILEDTGVSARALENPSLRLTLEQELALYKRIASLNTNPLLAHRTGVKLGLPNYGILGYAMVASPTLRDALQLMVEFAPLVSWAAHSVLTQESYRGEACLCLTIHPTPSDERTSVLEVESTFASLQTVFNELVAERVSFNRVTYSHPCPVPDSQPYEELFQCPVDFSQPKNSLYLSKALLARRLPHAQPEHASLLKDLCAETLISLRQDRGLVAAIKAYIDGYEQGVPSLDETAQYFHQSSRTLRRHLQAQGLSFRGLIDEARYSSAKRYLSSTNLTVEIIGKTLGYADVRSFRTAFKRWSGMSPAAYRGR